MYHATPMNAKSGPCDMVRPNSDRHVREWLLCGGLIAPRRAVLAVEARRDAGSRSLVSGVGIRNRCKNNVNVRIYVRIGLNAHEEKKRFFLTVEKTKPIEKKNGKIRRKETKSKKITMKRQNTRKAALKKRGKGSSAK